MHLPIWFILIVAYQLKHFLADFIFQNAWMLNKFRSDWKFLLPLLAHTVVHFVGTFCITVCLMSVQTAAILALFDMSVHFVMDRIKASPKYLGRYKGLSAKEYPTATDEEKRGNKLFWWSIGFDQMVHHLTHYTIVLYCVLHLASQ